MSDVQNKTMQKKKKEEEACIQFKQLSCIKLPRTILFNDLIFKNKQTEQQNTTTKKQKSEKSQST
jgi:hypothetical protein